MRSKANSRIATFVATLLATTGAQSFQPLVTDDTGTQGAGGNQLELAGTRAKNDVATARDAAFVYTRGLTDGLDVFVEVGRQSIDNGTTTETWFTYDGALAVRQIDVTSRGTQTIEATKIQ